MPLRTRITERFGCRHPVQQAGMGGMAPGLAVAVAEAGGIGMLSGVRGDAHLRDQLRAVPDGAVVGVNFLVPFLDRAAVETAATATPLVEFFWGAPDGDLVGAVHEVAGTAAVWQVGSADEARAAVDAGCDVVVVQGVEAGGHVRGTTPLLTLIGEVRSGVDVPLVAAGGIGTGRQMAAALGAGADAVRVGTRFVAAVESNAHPRYVEELIGAGADDTVLTTAFSLGWPDAPHRVLRSCVAAGDARGAHQVWTPNWPTTDDAGLGPDAVVAHALYAGHSVDAVRTRQSAAEIIAELVEEASTIRSPSP